MNPNASPNEFSGSDPDSSRSEQNEQTISSIVDQIDSQDPTNFFCERIEQQTERLRKISPFCHLSSYKLFNVIIKSGENLRQEQFATQLINKFTNFQIGKS